ncbi:MAG TPA: Tad domain-containing protein [Novosphingobium sp.]|nr:Tad domain-containing protein [Novosphingobium sp.]
MAGREPERKSSRPRGVLTRLAHDRAGNTFALVAASLAPLLALVGGGIDMGRSYLSQSRLQQACDAGVLAARKKLGSAAVVDGIVPSSVAEVGNRFFNLNFRDGAYGSEDRTFTMSLEENYAISGEATVNVPTTIMAIFGNENMPIQVDCEAQLNFSNTDVMMVLDTTGSMGQTNAGDSVSRIDALRQVVLDFYKQLEASKSPGTRVRYGFVPYAVNVNVGGLLADDWVVDEWTYQSRTKVVDYDKPYTYTYEANWKTISGSYADSVVNSYAGTYHAATAGSGGSGSEYGGGTGGSAAYYSCDGATPADTFARTDTLLSSVSEPYFGPPAGTKKTDHYRRVTNGNDYWTSLSGGTCKVYKRAYVTYTQEFDRISYPKADETWLYGPVTKDVSNWRAETSGCMEERQTYEIYSTEGVDFSQALDLDIDRVPTAGDPASQWRPMYPDLIWARALPNEKSNAWKVAPVKYSGNYFKPATYSGLVACPRPALKLDEMSEGEVSSYLASLTPNGQTYHDIGMIWGGRLISPTGLFAEENADLEGKPTTRHLIFLTDGQTESKELSYTAYGLEPLDMRRWDKRLDPHLNGTIEIRFAIACDEVKKRNVTVWVVGFGTTMNDVMKTCAGDGHWFQADDADQLKDTFNKIAKAMGELRISK